MRTLPVSNSRRLTDFEQYDFSGGLNIQDSPQKLADNDLTQADNVYLSTEGDLIVRKGIKANGVPVAGAVFGARGVFRFYQRLKNGAVTTFKQTVMQVGSSLYDADTGTLIGTVGQLGVNAQSASFAQVFDPSHAGGPTDILIIATGSGGPYVYDGTALTNLNAAPTSVAGALWLQEVNSVVFYGGIPSQPNLLVASYINQPTNTPGYATFAMTSAITGLCTLGVGAQTSLVVGYNQGISLITGFTPNSYIQQDIPHSDGVLSGQSMINVDGYLYFIGNFGIYRYDGNTFTGISRKVRPWILNDPLSQTHAMNGDRTGVWAMHYDRRIYFWYASGQGASSTYSNTALVWDVVLEGWTTYVCQALPLGAGCLLNAPGDPTPWSFQVIGQGNGQKYAFDVYDDSVFSVSDAGLTITSAWQTKYYKIGAGGTKKRLLRFYTELFSYNFNGVFSVITDYGTSTTSVQTLAASTGNSTYDTAVFDVSTFANELSYFKTRSDTNTQGEAFSFGVISPPPGTTPPTLTGYRYMGVTGRILQGTKN